MNKQEIFNGLDINQVESLERTKVIWDGDDTIILELPARAEIVITRVVNGDGFSELQLVSEKSARDFARAKARAKAEREIAKVISDLEFTQEY